MAALDAFFDLLSATLGAASGALITALANRQKTTSLNNKLVVSNRELEKIKLENDRLLKLIEQRENQILKQEQELLQHNKKQTNKKTRK